MEEYLLMREKQLILDDFNPNKSIFTNLQSLDLSNLNVIYPDSASVDYLQNLFSSLFTRSPRKYRILPKIGYRFWSVVEKLHRRIFLVIIQGGYFTFKRQNVLNFRLSPLHEVFVGYQLNKLNSPFFSKVYGGFVNPEDGFQYVIYQYIDGVKKDSLLQDNTNIFNALTLLRAVLIDAFNRIGFIHQRILSSILYKDLLEDHLFVIGGVKYISRYLPVIIDYSFARVVINGEDFSPLGHQMSASSYTYDTNEIDNFLDEIRGEIGSREEIPILEEITILKNREGVAKEVIISEIPSEDLSLKEPPQRTTLNLKTLQQSTLGIVTIPYLQEFPLLVKGDHTRREQLVIISKMLQYYEDLDFLQPISQRAFDHGVRTCVAILGVLTKEDLIDMDFEPVAAIEYLQNYQDNMEENNIDYILSLQAIEKCVERYDNPMTTNIQNDINFAIQANESYNKKIDENTLEELKLALITKFYT